MSTCELCISRSCHCNLLSAGIPGALHLTSFVQKRCTCETYLFQCACIINRCVLLRDTSTLRIQVHEDKLQCSQYQEIKLAADMSSLPNNALVLQQRPTQVSQTTLYSLNYLGSEKLHLAVGATFGQSLHEAGHCGPAGLADSMCNLLGKLHHVNMAELLAICNCMTFSCNLSWCEACFWSALANRGCTKGKRVHMHCRDGRHC